MIKYKTFMYDEYHNDFEEKMRASLKEIETESGKFLQLLVVPETKEKDFFYGRGNSLIDIYHNRVIIIYEI